jgi:hypothetical protein
MSVVTALVVTAMAIKERLEDDTRTIADLQRQIAELTACFHEQAAPFPRLSRSERFNSLVWRPPEQLQLLVAEDMGASRVTSPRRPAPPALD